MERSTVPKFYFDLRRALKSYGKNDTPWTPAASLIIGVDAALTQIRNEGIEQIWRRHERMARALRAGLLAIGMRLFSDHPSFAVTPVWVPDGLDWKQFNTTLKSTYGVTVAGGQDEFAGKIFRVSHLGYYDELDIITVLAAIERTLADCHWKVKPGSGVSAAQEYFIAHTS
jgi:aspartate aminotransferase-like enzyme